MGKCKFPIWPEWSDAEVNKEKWDSSKGSQDKKTSKSPNAVSKKGRIFEISKEFVISDNVLCMRY